MQNMLIYRVEDNSIPLLITMRFLNISLQSMGHKDCAALPGHLKLVVGARVILCCNVNCGDGLVNGARASNGLEEQII